jgi:hypothetical protein
MTFTPSATSSFSAGAVFWGMVWSVAVKASEIMKLFGFKNSRLSDHILLWVRDHKLLAVTGSELVNYSIHGIQDPLSVTFALGGTLTNLVTVFFVVPMICRIKKLV